MDFHWGIAFFLFGKKVIPVESQGNRTAVGSRIDVLCMQEAHAEVPRGQGTPRTVEHQVQAQKDQQLLHHHQARQKDANAGPLQGTLPMVGLAFHRPSARLT